MPSGLPGKRWAEAELSQAIIISECCKDAKINPKSGEEEIETKIPLKKSFMSPTFLAFLVVYVIYSTRVQSIRGTYWQFL